MENLPPYLLKAIEGACSIFRNVNFTIHGDVDKTRISIMFDNCDNEKRKRKSKAVLRRDAERLSKRMKNNTHQENQSTGDQMDIRTDGDIIIAETDALQSVTSTHEKEHEDLDMTTSDISDIAADTNANIIADHETIREVHEKCIMKVQEDTNVKIISEKEESTYIAPKEIITGRSPCNDTHFQKVVCYRSREGTELIGKVKKKDTVVVRNEDCITKKVVMKHVNRPHYSYDCYVHYLSRFPDVRKHNDRDMKDLEKFIPLLDRYAEEHKLCPWCFENT